MRWSGSLREPNNANPENAALSIDRIAPVSGRNRSISARGRARGLGLLENRVGSALSTTSLYAGLNVDSVSREIIGIANGIIQATCAQFPLARDTYTGLERA